MNYSMSYAVVYNRLIIVKKSNERPGEEAAWTEEFRMKMREKSWRK
jgi:hypothetical protein